MVAPCWWHNSRIEASAAPWKLRICIIKRCMTCPLFLAGLGQDRTTDGAAAGQVTSNIFPHRMQGARIGKNAYLDSLDVSDFDLINIGDDVAINEGATLLGHYFKDGHLHFGEVC